MTEDEEDRPFCSRCHEDFELAEEPARWQMGFLRPMSKAPRRFHRRYQRTEPGFEQGNYLCGNCYFDLTDGDA